MATGYVNAANQLPALFRKYDQVLKQQIPMEVSPCLKRIKTDKRASPVGDSWYLKAQTGFNERGHAAIAQDGNLPTSGYGSYKEMSIRERAIMGQIKIDMRSWKGRMSDKTAVITGDIGAKEMRDMGTVHAKETSRMLFTAGDGLVATVAASTSSSTTVTLLKTTAQGGWGAQYIRENMWLDTYSTGGSQRGTGGDSNRVAALSLGDTVDTLTMDDATTFTAGDFIYKEDVFNASANLEADGLDTLIDDGTLNAAFQGLTISSNPWFKSVVKTNSGTSRPFQLNLIEEMINAVWLRTEKVGQLSLVSNRGQKSEYLNLAQPAMIINTGGSNKGANINLGASHGNIGYGNYEWIEDPNCQYGRIKFLDFNQLAKLEAKPFGQHREIGGWNWLGTTDTMSTYYAEYMNYMIYRRNGQGKLTDLSENTV